MFKSFKFEIRTPNPPASHQRAISMKRSLDDGLITWRFKAHEPWNQIERAAFHKFMLQKIKQLQLLNSFICSVDRMTINIFTNFKNDILESSNCYLSFLLKWISYVAFLFALQNFIQLSSLHLDSNSIFFDFDLLFTLHNFFVMQDMYKTTIQISYYLVLVLFNAVMKRENKIK